MKLRLSAPSKTFLLGEYLVLKGGRALVLGTKPRFLLTADSKGRGHVSGIHPSSPAGQLIERNSEIFSQWDISFSDPHEGAGGFGASSAQYLFVYSILNTVNSRRGARDAVAELSVGDLWTSFRDHADSGAGILPSGADVIGQATGEVALVEICPHGDASATRGHVLQWKFKDYGFFLVRTGRKVATHHHLRQIEDIDTAELKTAYAVGEKAFELNDGNLLASGVTLYQNALYNLGLVSQESSELIEALSATEAVAAVKGCGALGADVLFIMFEKNKESIVRDRLNLLGLPIIATENDLSEGLKLTVDRTRVTVKGVCDKGATL